MSLVNDVLDSQNYDKPSGYVGRYYDGMNENNHKIKLLIVVILFLVICLIAGFSYLYLFKQKNIGVKDTAIENTHIDYNKNVSDILIYRDINEVTRSEPTVKDAHNSKYDTRKNAVAIKKKPEATIQKSLAPAVSKPSLTVAKQKIVEKKLLKSSATPKPTRVENISRDLPFHISEEIKLRNMLSTDPASVYPYIKKHHNDGKKNARLLAIAAQAEQKTDHHDSAIQLYTQLIEIERKEPRWYSAIGFSFERIGDFESAYKMYSAAIQMGGLPNNLNTFTLSRLENLNAIKEAKI